MGAALSFIAASGVSSVISFIFHQPARSLAEALGIRTYVAGSENFNEINE